MYRTTLSSPLGTLTLASDGTALTGLWLEGQKYFAATMGQKAEEQNGLPCVPAGRCLAGCLFF